MGSLSQLQMFLLRSLTQTCIGGSPVIPMPQSALLLAATPEGAILQSDAGPDEIESNTIVAQEVLASYVFQGESLIQSDMVPADSTGREDAGPAGAP